MSQVVNFELLDEIKQKIRSDLDVSYDISEDEIKDIIEKAVFEKAKEIFLNTDEKANLIIKIFNSLKRYDIIQPLIEDPSITEIMVNGPNDIFIERNGHVTRFNGRFENVQVLENVIRNILSKVNRTANESEPIADARLMDGSRVAVLLPPIALNGPSLTIRKFPQKPFVMKDLIKFGTLTKECAYMFEKLIKAKYNIFVSGGTGSGKTTLLNVLTNFIPSDERIITIEDSAELQINSLENLIRLETRRPNVQNVGEVSIRQLIRASLRMRPERIIVGEVRGPEALDMLQAMNTGHDGSLSTGHANSSKDMLSRLETMVLLDTNFPLEAIRKQIASAIDVIIHISRLRDRRRVITEVNEIVGFVDGEILLNPIFIFEEQDDEKVSEKERASHQEKVIGSLKRTRNDFINKEKFKLAGIKEYEYKKET